MRISHLNIYYTIEKNILGTTTLYTYTDNKLFRYEIEYDKHIECFKTNKYNLFKNNIVEYNITTVNLNDEYLVEQYFEVTFGRQHIFLHFRDLIEFVITQIKQNKTNITVDDMQDIIELYPERFI